MNLPNPQKRDKILRFEAAVKECPQVECPVAHFFAPGMYARQMTIQAGTMLTGAIHRHSHINTLSQGDVLISSEFGDERHTAPSTWVSEPGIKRAIFALTDATFTTYHATDSTDLAEIEEQMIAKSYDELEGGA